MRRPTRMTSVCGTAALQSTTACVSSRSKPADRHGGVFAGAAGGSVRHHLAARGRPCVAGPDRPTTGRHRPVRGGAQVDAVATYDEETGELAVFLVKGSVAGR
jgi:hypothetical protein